MDAQLKCKYRCPLTEANHAFFSKLSEATFSLFIRFLTVGMCLAEKLVSIANHLFFPCLRYEILMG